MKESLWHSQKNWSGLASNSSRCQFFTKYETQESLGNGILPNGKEMMEYLPTWKVKFVVNICITYTNAVFNLFYNGCFAMYTHKLLLVLQNMWQNFESYSTGMIMKICCWTASEFVWHEATEERTLYQEKLWGVKMTDLDKKFYEKTKPCSMCWLFFNTRRSKVGNKP